MTITFVGICRAITHPSRVSERLRNGFRNRQQSCTSLLPSTKHPVGPSALRLADGPEVRGHVHVGVGALHSLVDVEVHVLALEAVTKCVIV